MEKGKANPRLGHGATPPWAKGKAAHLPLPCPAPKLSPKPKNFAGPP